MANESSYEYKRNAIREKIETAGKAMLKEMSDNDETATLESGVVIHPLEAGPDGFGKGVKPTAASTVKVHYHGTLPDGTVFGKDATIHLADRRGQYLGSDPPIPE